MKIRPFSKSYNDRRVLNIAETEFAPGRVYALIGANGSGKSTFARILAYIEKPDDGRRAIEGLTVGYMPQKSYAFRMSTKKNILLAGNDSARAEALMRELNIDSLSKARATVLSGGETAKMALARIMMPSFDLLIMDEPTAAMDISSAITAEGLIRRHCLETNCSLILITHSLRQAKRISDEIIFLHEGEIIERAERDKLLYSPSDERTKEFLSYYGF